MGPRGGEGRACNLSQPFLSLLVRLIRRVSDGCLLLFWMMEIEEDIGIA